MGLLGRCRVTIVGVPVVRTAIGVDAWARVLVGDHPTTGSAQSVDFSRKQRVTVMLINDSGMIDR